MPLLVVANWNNIKLYFVGLLLAFVLFGCVKNRRDEGADPRGSAVRYAAQLLQISPEEVLEKYAVRDNLDDGRPVIVYEFFSKELLGDRDDKDMESMHGGFDDYFSLELDSVSLDLIRTYMADE